MFRLADLIRSRFAHDRFAQAVSIMKQCHDVEKMNFIIAQTMMKYCADSRDLYTMARHICQATRLIRARVKQRSQHRKVLQAAADMAIGSGARPTALWYSRQSLQLLQPNCWEDHAPDVDHEETRKLHLQTAELLWYQGQSEEALTLLSEVFTNVKAACARASAWMLKSRIYSDASDHNTAMESLLTSMDELGVHIRQPYSYEQCDVAFNLLRQHLQSTNCEDAIQQPVSHDPNVIAVGKVLAEAAAVAFWGDDLTFLHMAIEMVKLHIFNGRFTQIGMGCSLLAMVSYSRYKDIELGGRMGDLALLLFDSSSDPWSNGAGLTIHVSLVEHLRVPIRSYLSVLESAVEAAFAGSGPQQMMLSFASMAAARLYLCQDMSELENFCTETPEELPDCLRDTRGGVLLVAVKQVTRALQGKTSWHSPESVMSDDNHQTSQYMEFIDKHATCAERPRDIYWGLAMLPLYVYGYHDKAIEVGTSMMGSIGKLWSMRISYLAFFYFSLAVLTQHFDNPTQSNLDSRLDEVLKYKAEIDFARSACDANYGMWSLILEAFLCEIREEFNAAVLAYEVSVPSPVQNQVKF
jgi:hypothetical protein